MNKNNILCIILAAGSGTRARFNLEGTGSNNIDPTKSNIPKQYLKIAGKSILEYSLNVILAHKLITQVIVTIDPLHVDLYTKIINKISKNKNYKKLLPPINGGTTRQESVFLALKSQEELKPKIVLIHDAARPFIDTDLLDRIISNIAPNCAVFPYIKIADTVKKLSDVTISTIDRKDLLLAQTPQGFMFEDIYAAHKKFATAINITDDISLAEKMGHKIIPVMGSKLNFKITDYEDIKKMSMLVENKLAEKKLLEDQLDENQLVKNNFETRCGIGFDVHSFCEPKLANGNFIRICGINIPFPKSLKGHSDADVGLHALMDALLGSVGKDDIGVHFPPSDMRFKDADSCLFLEYAAKLLRNDNAKIVNIDITIICEEPKLGSYRIEMRKKIAQILDIDITRINIKGKTTEKLGFTGRKEGIAAQAIATIQIPC